MKRVLGKSGIEVSAVGMGCWAIGGAVEQEATGKPSGWSGVDDDVSIRAVHAALDAGITLFDTADSYGAGHSERVLGRALQGKRDKAAIATKFSNTFDEKKRVILSEPNARPEYIRSACEASLKRLGTDVIDLYQFHWNAYESGKGGTVRDVLEELVAHGKIRTYGWSTDNPASIRVFAEGKNCSEVQFGLNVLNDRPDMLPLLDEFNLAGLNKNPLNKGLLTGKFTREDRFPDDDLRWHWDLREGPTAKLMDRFEAIRDLLIVNNCTCAQGAICWNLTRHNKTIPIPGITAVQDNSD